MLSRYTVVRHAPESPSFVARVFLFIHTKTDSDVEAGALPCDMPSALTGFTRSLMNLSFSSALALASFRRSSAAFCMISFCTQHTCSLDTHSVNADGVALLGLWTFGVSQERHSLGLLTLFSSFFFRVTKCVKTDLHLVPCCINMSLAKQTQKHHRHTRQTEKTKGSTITEG